ncbi:MAG: glycosyltransferase [Synergistaceae bacterium]|nr:glycosyltransferase [Synergistaceae bacterium]
MLKNIVIVSDNADINGGAADVAVNTASMLAERGYKIYFFAGGGEPDKKLIHSNIFITNLNQYDLIHNPNKLVAAFQGIYNFKARREFAKLLSTLNKDETIIHIHSWTKVLSSSIFKAAFESGIKIFVTVHDYFLSCPNGGFYDFVENHICERQPLSLKCILCNCDKRNYYHKIWRVIRNFVQNRVIFKNFDKIGYIFISEFSRKQLLRRMPAPKNQFLVQNPIYFADRFRIEAENNKIFLYIGRLSEEKGVRNFCRAVNNTGV